MTLEQIAQQAMDYLDSVCVAAEYEIRDGCVNVYTNWINFVLLKPKSYYDPMSIIEDVYPQKSPA